MKKGRITESVLKRSVLKYVHKGRYDIKKGAGCDCAFLEWNANGLAVSTETVTLPITESAKYAIYAAVNNLAAGGMQATAVTLAITLPAEAEEEQLQALMKQAQEACRESDLQIVGGHTEVSESVTVPIVSVNAFGTPLMPATGQQNELPKIGPGLSVVMTKWIGLEGTAILAREKEAELFTRYPMPLIRAAQGFDKYLPILPEAATALKSGVCAMHDARNGGVFGALFELSRSTGVGLSVDLKQIPVKQETIEICEFYDLNPYELLSGGCLLLLTSDGEALVEALDGEGIPAAVIGNTIEGNDKIVLNGEETRFLEPAKTDEIWKVNFCTCNQETGKE